MGHKAETFSRSAVIKRLYYMGCLMADQSNGDFKIIPSSALVSVSCCADVSIVTLIWCCLLQLTISFNHHATFHVFSYRQYQLPVDGMTSVKHIFYIILIWTFCPINLSESNYLNTIGSFWMHVPYKRLVTWAW